MEVQSLSQEDPLEWKMATHSSILAWEIFIERSLMGYGHGVAELDMTEQAYTYTNLIMYFHFFCTSL